jgi:hypothetical protein
MLVQEVTPGEFHIWYGTNELPLSIEFTATDEELAAHNLYRPLPEDTLPPAPWFEMGPRRFARNEQGQVQTYIEWQPLIDLETARDLINMDLDAEIEERTKVAGGLSLAQPIATLRDQIAIASSFDVLLSIDFASVNWPKPVTLADKLRAFAQGQQS